MKTVLIPLYFQNINEREKQEFKNQLDVLAALYAEEAVFLPPRMLGESIPLEADAAVFPQLVGEAFSRREEFGSIDIPVIVLTSRFGTVEMWDWEIVSFLREETKLAVFSPYSVELAKTVLRAIACKKHMKSGVRFLMFQDSPGEGMQANIFKRFYWWERECTDLMERAFGVNIIYRSYKELNETAGAISDDDARAVAKDWDVEREGVSDSRYLAAVKLYMAIKRVIEEVGGVEGVGANCLNESFNSVTTPCLAWNMIFEKDGVLWACEGDTVTLISKFIIYSALKRPVMMTNIYPFLVGMAALKHEKIDEFPQVDNPDNHALGVHCGYFGFAPQSFCAKWTLKPKVLEIVDKEALMVDCEMEKGFVTLAKIHPSMKKMIVIECEITDYVNYPGSDCRNGALIHYRNDSGHKVMDTLCSHHALIIKGDCTHELKHLAKVFGFECEVL